MGATIPFGSRSTHSNTERTQGVSMHGKSARLSRARLNVKRKGLFFPCVCAGSSQVVAWILLVGSVLLVAVVVYFHFAYSTSVGFCQSATSILIMRGRVKLVCSGLNRFCHFERSPRPASHGI